MPLELLFKRHSPLKNKRRSFAISAILLMVVLTSGNFAPAVTAAPATGPQRQYFNQTGHSISGAIFRYYRQSGGLERHGYPLSELLLEKGHYYQYFERSVLEFSPMYAETEHEISLLPLGRLEAESDKFASIPPFEATPNRWYFPETGHSLSSPFLNFWRNNGDEVSLGMPQSEAFTEKQPDGSSLLVQYFEYVKLEFNPDSGQNVQISLLGQKKALADLKPYQLSPVSQAHLVDARDMRIPSLMFHYVRTVDRKKDPLGYDLSVTPANFAIFLDWIKANGYNTVTIQQILDHMKYGVQLPEKAINLRFDDGHADMWEAYQEMNKRGMTANFYVITRRLELTPEQWRQIDRDGFEVSAHTRTHPDLKGVKDLAGEITGSKMDMELMLGHPVRTFAYPYGSFNANVQKVVQDSGFELAVSTLGGYNWTIGNLFKEPTASVTGNDTLESFASKIKNGIQPPLTAQSMPK